MSQLYDISYSDYESQERWVLEGPELTNEQWEALWEEIRLIAIEKIIAQFSVVYEDMILQRIVEILLSEKGFKALEAAHNKHFNIAGFKNKTGLLNGVKEEYLPRVLGGK